tara:strand:+ start:154 stop:858 length:705 start_codon:yes stop_codon:yes gene_type:complete
MKMTENSNIINWENVFACSKTFQENKPAKWAFVEEFFVRDFYEKLYETYPNKDDSWSMESADDKSNYRKWWGTDRSEHFATDVEDTSFSESWNKFHRYLFSDELISNFRKFSGIPVKLKQFSLMLLTRGGYQLPHIHNVGPSTMILMLFFSKNWKKGDPGGTFLTTDETESNMVFEPYNLDNSALIFQDGPHAGHGVRQITKDVERRALLITLDQYSSETGWNDTRIKKELREI